MDLLLYIQTNYPTYEGDDLKPFYELPKDRSLADIALPCFQLAKALGKAPNMIATELAASLKLVPGVAQIVAVGPYVNFSFDPARLAAHLLPDIQEHGTNYGAGEALREHIVVESPGPNTNKPLHLGHVRNMLLGSSLCRILKYAGYQVTPVDIINDRGIHICKSMLSYQLEGNNAEPNKKSDHYVGDRYVRYDELVQKDPSLEAEAQKMLQRREDEDPATRTLRQRMHERALSGIRETYARYGVVHAKAYAESEHYLRGKEVVADGLAAGIFTKNEKNNIVFVDPDLGEKVVLRADGTSIYLTQDLALAKIRFADRKMDRMVYVVGNEQEDHFKFLFRILERMGLPFAKHCYHLSYGMISLPDGKMKSRKGNTVDADTLADEMHSEAVELLKNRYPDLPPAEVHQRAEAIAMAAIKFFTLKYDASKDFVFDRASSLSFDGESGPYIQYTVARCSALLRKGSAKFTGVKNYELLTSPHAKQLLVHLAYFPHTVTEAAHRYQPALIARYVLELAQLVNTYYHHERVLDDDMTLQQQRLSLISASRQTLENGLSLLGIDVLEEM